MNNEKEIAELFKSFNPNVNTKHIMYEISSKMDMIDMVRPEHEQMKRFYRTLSACCFIVGLLTSCFLMGFVLFHPSAGVALPDILHLGEIFTESTPFFTDHGDMILAFLAAVSFILGSLPLIYMNEWSKS